MLTLWGVATGLAARVHSLIAHQRHEAAEWINVMLGAVLVVPTWLYPAYLTRSPFLQPLDASIGRGALLAGGVPLMAWWLGCLLLCGDPPPGRPDPRRDARQLARMAGFLMAVFAWGTLAALFVRDTPLPWNGGTILFGGLGLLSSAVAGIHLAYQYNVEMLRRAEVQERQRRREAERAAAGAGNAVPTG